MCSHDEIYCVISGTDCEKPVMGEEEGRVHKDPSQIKCLYIYYMFLDDNILTLFDFSHHVMKLSLSFGSAVSP